MSTAAEELAAAKRAAKDGDGAALLELAQPGHDPTTRWWALRALGSQGDAAVLDGLLELLDRDGDEKLQTNGAKALGGFRDERAVERLREMLAGAGPHYVAIESLCRIGGDAAAEALGGGLGLTDMRLRARSAEALGEVGGERATALLVPALRDEAPEVRAEAAGALGRIRDERAVEALEHALADDDSQVRSRAVDALSAIGGTRAREALEGMLPRLGSRRSRWVVRRHIRKLGG
jgi:HEAT repeat protein